MSASPFESRVSATIHNLPLFGDVVANDKGPITVGWTLEDFHVLIASQYWWDEPPVMAYTHCLAWMLRRMGWKDVLVDVSCGVSDFSSGLLEGAYENVNVIFAPTFLGSIREGHWALIVIKKADKTIVVTTSKGTCKTSPKDYAQHYNKLLMVTNWGDPRTVKTMPKSQRVLDVYEHDGVWRVGQVVLDCTGPQCGPLMLTAFRDEIAQMNVSRRMDDDGVGDGVAARLLPTADAFPRGADRLAALHHMGVILRDMKEQGDVSLDEAPAEGALTLGLFGLSPQFFQTVMSHNKYCHCSHVCDLEKRHLVALACCNRRHHVRCFARAMRTKEESTEFGNPQSCSYCQQYHEEIFIVKMCGDILRWSVVAPEGDGRVATRAIRMKVVDDLYGLCPLPEDCEIIPVDLPVTPEPVEPVDSDRSVQPFPKRRRVLVGALEEDGSTTDPVDPACASEPALTGAVDSDSSVPPLPKRRRLRVAEVDEEETESDFSAADTSARLAEDVVEKEMAEANEQRADAALNEQEQQVDHAIREEAWEETAAVARAQLVRDAEVARVSTEARQSETREWLRVAKEELAAEDAAWKLDVEARRLEAVKEALEEEGRAVEARRLEALEEEEREAEARRLEAVEERASVDRAREEEREDARQESLLLLQETQERMKVQERELSEREARQQAELEVETHEAQARDAADRLESDSRQAVLDADLAEVRASLETKRRARAAEALAQAFRGAELSARVNLDARQIHERQQKTAQDRTARRTRERMAARLVVQEAQQERINRDLAVVDEEVLGGGGRVPSHVELSGRGGSSTLASPVDPPLRQRSQETLEDEEDDGGGCFNHGDEDEDEEEDDDGGSSGVSEPVGGLVPPVAVRPPPFAVGPVAYGVPGAVDAKRDTEVWVLKFGCMAFAVGGSRDLAVLLQQQLRRLFVEPSPLDLMCPVCGASAPTAPVFLWHMQNGCANVDTPVHLLWNASFPMFFYVSANMIQSMRHTVPFNGVPVDLLNPRQMPTPVGPCGVHRHKSVAAEVAKERGLLGVLSKPSVNIFFSKKLAWLDLTRNHRPPVVCPLPKVYMFSFLKDVTDWPDGMLESKSYIEKPDEPDDV
jgi:hypothetical protein